MNCPNCSSTNVQSRTVTEWIPYGDEPQAFQATFPVMLCKEENCNFGWRDWQAEDAIEKAQYDYIESLPSKDDENLENFKAAIREALEEHLRKGASPAPYAEALIILASEL